MNWNLLNFIYIFVSFEYDDEERRVDVDEKKMCIKKNTSCVSKRLLLDDTHAQLTIMNDLLVYFLCLSFQRGSFVWIKSFIYSFIHISRVRLLCTLQQLDFYTIFGIFHSFKKWNLLPACLTDLPPTSTFLSCEITHLRSSREGAEIDWSFFLLLLCFFVVVELLHLKYTQQFTHSNKSIMRFKISFTFFRKSLSTLLCLFDSCVDGGGIEMFTLLQLTDYQLQSFCVVCCVFNHGRFDCQNHYTQ